MELIVYGLKPGETRDYMEDLLCSGLQTKEQCNKVIEVATKEGFHSFRIATFNWEKPNFVQALNT